LEIFVEIFLAIFLDNIFFYITLKKNEGIGLGLFGFWCGVSGLGVGGLTRAKPGNCTSIQYYYTHVIDPMTLMTARV
jgi:hypothetical protein